MVRLDLETLNRRIAIACKRFAHLEREELVRPVGDFQPANVTTGQIMRANLQGA